MVPTEIVFAPCENIEVKGYLQRKMQSEAEEKRLFKQMRKERRLVQETRPYYNDREDPSYWGTKTTSCYSSNTDNKNGIKAAVKKLNASEPNCFVQLKQKIHIKTE